MACLAVLASVEAWRACRAAGISSMHRRGNFATCRRAANFGFFGEGEDQDEAFRPALTKLFRDEMRCAQRCR